jgi:large subunit ribosomal protein L3
MTKFILGKKAGMTRIFDKAGKMVPVTVIEAGPAVVTQIKTLEKDGYAAVQIGYGKAKKINKPRAGHVKGLGNIRHIREFQIDGKISYKVGDKIDVSVFAEGDMVKASGISKSKGFAGGMKRHGFAGGPASHGQKHSARERGSVGPRFPEHVVKGVRMPGRMGGTRSTMRKLTVMGIDKENNLLALKGAIPGRKGTLIEVISEK